MTTYKKGREDATPDQLRKIIKKIIQLVSESPLMAAQVNDDTDKQDNYISTVHQGQDRTKEKDGRLIRNTVADNGKSNTKHASAYLSFWPWLLSLVVLIVALLIYRFRRRIIN